MDTARRHVILRYLPTWPMPPTTGLIVYNQPFHPLVPKLLHIYRTRDRNSLWMRVDMRPLMMYKRAPRIWCARRARHALRGALFAHGYDWRGQQMEPGAGKSALKGNLTGSLTLTLQREFLLQDYATVRSEIREMVDDLVWNLKNRGDELRKESAEKAAQVKAQRKTATKQKTAEAVAKGKKARGKGFKLWK